MIRISPKGALLWFKSWCGVSRSSPSTIVALLDFYFSCYPNLAPLLTSTLVVQALGGPQSNIPICCFLLAPQLSSSVWSNPSSSGYHSSDKHINVTLYSLHRLQFNLSIGHLIVRSGCCEWTSGRFSLELLTFPIFCRYSFGQSCLTLFTR